MLQWGFGFLPLIDELFLMVQGIFRKKIVQKIDLFVSFSATIQQIRALITHS